MLLLFVALPFILTSCKKRNLEANEIIPNTINDSTSIFDNSATIESSIFAGTEKLQGELLLKQSSNNKFTERKWQGIPSIGISAEGILFVAWYSGTNDEGPGNYITVSVSLDKGKTWRSNELIINPTSPNVRFFDAALWNDKYGSLYLSWAKSTGSSLWDGKGGVWYSKLKYSGDSISYSNPAKLADGVMMNKPIICDNQTKILFPIGVWKLYFNSDINKKAFIYSGEFDNRFKKLVNFQKKGVLNIPDSKRWYDEHQVVQLADGTYFAMIRGIDKLFYLRSKDGITWDEAQEFKQLGATTSSRFFLGKLKSGKLALVLNNSTSRNNMKIFLSGDDGITWSNGYLIDNKLPVSYPDLVQGMDGRIYITYDFDRFGLGNIFCVSMTEQDILTLKTENIQRSVVSKK